jgi:undecaprenyl diphosphate synthase
MRLASTLLENNSISTEPARKDDASLGISESCFLNKGKVPTHVAIIPDGNRRWAKQHGLKITEGHNQGAENVMSIIRAAKDAGIKYVTFYVFSTENWSRDRLEVIALMHILNRFIIDKREEMVREGVRLHTIGDLTKLSQNTNIAITETKKATLSSDNVHMILALNYGARDELTRTFHKIFEDIKNQKIHEDCVDEKLISRYLDTSEWPDPDLLIRTGGVYRISNYLLWQLSYTEIYISRTLWPDFSSNDFFEAMRCYQGRDRRFGGG